MWPRYDDAIALDMPPAQFVVDGKGVVTLKSRRVNESQQEPGLYCSMGDPRATVALGSHYAKPQMESCDRVSGLSRSLPEVHNGNTGAISLSFSLFLTGSLFQGVTLPRN